MEKICLHTAGAPPALGPYSQAVVAGGFLFLSGQGALAPDGSGLVHGASEEATRLAFAYTQAGSYGAGMTVKAGW